MKIDFNFMFDKYVYRFCHNHRDIFEALFDPKEQSMWMFVLTMIKKDSDKAVYNFDDDNDTKYLKSVLKFHNKVEQPSFTFDELVKYLSSLN